MGWAVGWENGRDVGYGVPAVCDHPMCDEGIDRGLAYVCGDEHGGGSRGCGLYFCPDHLLMVDDPQDDQGMVDVCERCVELDDNGQVTPFDPKPDVEEWVRWKLTDESWAPWRADHPEQVAAMRRTVAAS